MQVWACLQLSRCADDDRRHGDVVPVHVLVPVPRLAGPVVEDGIDVEAGDVLGAGVHCILRVIADELLRTTQSGRGQVRSCLCGSDTEGPHDRWLPS